MVAKLQIALRDGASQSPIILLMLAPEEQAF
jgi:hypothetical protein